VVHLGKEAADRFVNKGSYGCVFRELTCVSDKKKSSTHTTTKLLTKLISSNTIETKHELDASRILQLLDPKHERFLYLLPDNICTTVEPDQWKAEGKCNLPTFQEHPTKVIGVSIPDGGMTFESCVRNLLMHVFHPSHHKSEKRQGELLGVYLLRHIIYLYDSMLMLHQSDLVHLDIAGNNIVMDPHAIRLSDQIPKFIDFGFSTSISTLTQSPTLYHFRNYYERYPAEINVLVSLTIEPPDRRTTDMHQLFQWIISSWMYYPQHLQWLPTYNKIILPRPSIWKEWDTCAFRPEQKTAPKPRSFDPRHFQPHPCVKPSVSLTEISALEIEMTNLRNRWESIRQLSPSQRSEIDKNWIRTILTQCDTLMLSNFLCKSTSPLT